MSLEDCQKLNTKDMMHAGKTEHPALEDPLNWQGNLIISSDLKNATLDKGGVDTMKVSWVWRHVV
jgi:hypothetical protein